MKTKALVVGVALILVGLIFAGGCATAPKINSPENPESTLLIGRITLICTGFPANYHLNGTHKNGINVYLIDDSTNETISIRSRGADGCFHFVGNYDHDRLFYIDGFYFETGSSMQTITMPTQLEGPPYIVLEANAVNNLGDIVWRVEYSVEGTTDYDERGSHSYFDVKEYHDFKGNCNELKSWFKTKYPESDWNQRKWYDLEIVTQ